MALTSQTEPDQHRSEDKRWEEPISCPGEDNLSDDKRSPLGVPYNYELLTETISTAAYNQFHPEGESTTQPDATGPTPVLPGVEEDLTVAANPGANPVPEPPSLRDFVMVAHMFWSLLLAFVGGWVSLLIYWTGKRQAQEEQKGTKGTKGRQEGQASIPNASPPFLVAFVTFGSNRSARWA